MDAIALVLLAGFAAVQATLPKLPIVADFNTVKTFRCDFTESEGHRTTAEGVTSPAKRGIYSGLAVNHVDYKTGTARFISNSGGETVQVLDGDQTISFLGMNKGNVTVLSIFKRLGSISTYRAAYSRHLQLTTGEVTISQSYGLCRGLI
jgi:hypothetical protein